MATCLFNLKKSSGFKILLFCLWFCSSVHGQLKDRVKSPNFIIIFTDDQGYGDLGCFGGAHVSTPNIDRMAAEGMKLTSFYVAAPVCSPSRAALMTGCYPKRINMATGSNFGVLLAADSKGLHPNEITIAEVLKTKGYATGIIGKWHLGDQPEFLPTKQGFDEFYGLPYSHDIHPFHSNNVKFNFPDLPLLKDETVVELNPDANYLTQRITDKAVNFIERHKDEPFLLYIPHPLPHKPLYASPEFMKEVSSDIKTELAKENGNVNYKVRDKIYPQAINEIDASVGKILASLKANGLDENTLVIFTSDNGPSRNGLGSAGPLRGNKGETFEGGMREPAVVWWPGNIPAGTVSDQILTTMDFLPTFAKLANAEIPNDRIIDGKDIWSVLSGKQEENKAIHEQFYYYKANQLEAVRSGNWKYRKQGEKKILYNLKTDLGEVVNVASKYPEIVEKLDQYFNGFEKELGIGEELSNKCRPAGFVEKPKALNK
ncbi:sulfatase [Mariniflexile sp. AS56]|uniref:sulfatase family protein n=1 Tax=Mariniflexile sp. AS56 TaxID=3063957 RepID=UPI0026F0C828|nr:sulfatase [Mariniflexile sp. AS56]MDO7172371.1 sulfatase [Mariniflexile sp. AS56]